MKKILIYSLFLGSFIALFSGIKPQLVQAEGKTQGNISFTEDTSPEEPVDPEDPEEPIDPNRPPTEGPYSLSYVSDFQFGTQSISEKSQEYYAQLDKITSEGTEKETPNFVQFTDKSGTSKGWSLTARQTQPFTNENGFELKNTYFIFRNLYASTPMVQAGTPTEIMDEVKLSSEKPNEAVPVVKAGPETGQGTWTIQFGETLEKAKNSVSFLIPGDTPKEEGTYATTIEWTFTNSL
ncbi:hypothetical protein UAY_02737 [Enterococcus moraviensis ATCC BAA-383]|uniref:WxL domain-containing protein n=1 Tax=Enterococcus moraviensis ATCC BAA-383 TaxID=1158609 RepID=R2SP84_9ENTE|nr:WxL domain-containing protein [Enterococcus moraviensis]EOH97005.1 hypothetical protein UAY_02737 [Enterococcus moraviensis ATCC BAA-383]EOT65795.1 hypothetical protein I586_02064 [Enterococcus moraviensis ATCC BAA-383]